MAYSEYPPGGSSSPGSYDAGYGEYPYSGGGEGAGVPEEPPIDDLGYLSPKVQMLRRVKSVILVVELLIMFILVYIAWEQRMSDFQGLSSKPWVPLAPILFMVLLMGVVMVITGIIFRVLEIHATESGSQKVLLANSAFRSALTSMVVAIVFLVIMLYLPTAPFVQEALVSKEETTKDYGEETYRFKVQDEFLVTRVTSIKVTTEYTENLALVKKDYYENFTKEYQQYMEGSRSLQSLLNYTHDYKIILLLNTTQLTVEGSNATNLEYGEWRIYVNVISDSPSKIKYELTREVQPELLGNLTIFLLIFAILDGAWMVAALVIKQRFKKYSIYT